jgi:hypothetical protein
MGESGMAGVSLADAGVFAELRACADGTGLSLLDPTLDTAYRGVSILDFAVTFENAQRFGVLNPAENQKFLAMNFPTNHDHVSTGVGFQILAA